MRAMTRTPAAGQHEQQPGAAGRRVRGLDAQQRRAQRRADLITSALTLFGDKGYPNVSIEEICQTAYVGTKSFYELFDSKEACYLALFGNLAADLEARMQQAVRAEPGNEPGGMERLIDTFARSLVRDPRVAKVVFGQSPAISATVETQRRANRRWAAAFLETVWRQYEVVDAGVPEGGLRPIAVGVIGGMFELIVDWLHDHDPGQEQDVESLIAQLSTFHRVACAGLTLLR